MRAYAGRSLAGPPSTDARICTPMTDSVAVSSPTRCGAVIGSCVFTTMADCGAGALAALEHAAANTRTHRTFVKTRERANRFLKNVPEPEIRVVVARFFMQIGFGRTHVELR